MTSMSGRRCDGKARSPDRTTSNAAFTSSARERDQGCGASREQTFRDLAAERFRIRCRALRLLAQSAGAVRGENRAREPDSVTLDASEPGDGSAATGVQKVEQRPLGEDLPVRDGVIEARDPILQAGIVVPSHDGQRALPYGREHRGEREYLGDFV